jgi:1-deoxy-D-xylulose-5-phosphate reductoisomerase
MVEFSDGSIIAQLAAADMKLPIQYALCHPDRRPNKLARLDLASIGKLNFFKPDLEKFPCLQYACKAANIGGTMPAVMSAADEIAVQSFLDQEIRFSQISQVIAAVMKKHKTIASPDLAAIINAAGWAREEARKYVNNIG